MQGMEPGKAYLLGLHKRCTSFSVNRRPTNRLMRPLSKQPYKKDSDAPKEARVGGRLLTCAAGHTYSQSTTHPETQLPTNLSLHTTIKNCKTELIAGGGLEW